MKMKYFIYTFFIFLAFQLKAQTYPWIHFNATSDSYVDLGDSSHMKGFDDIFGGNEISITMWIRWNDKNAEGTGNWANFFTLSDSTAGDNGVFWMQHDWGNTKFEFAIQTVNGRKYVWSSTNPQEDTWYHFAATYDHTIPNQNMKLYINGNLESTLNHTGVIKDLTDKMKLTIGRWPSPANNFRMFNGDIDEVSVWSKALSQSEIQSIMNNPESVTGSEYDTSNIVSYYNFDGGSMVDLTGSGNIGTAGASVLPVELKEFRAEQKGKQVNIFWITLSEINNDFFTIEKSLDLTNFDFVDEVSGAGNSNYPIEYTSTDFSPFPGISYYRLSQTDFNGQSEILSNTSLDFKKLNGFEVDIYPNPAIAGSSFYLKLPFVLESEFNLLINNFLGKECISDLNIINQDDHTLLIIQTEQEIAPGIYFITFEMGNEVVSKKILIQ